MRLLSIFFLIGILFSVQLSARDVPPLTSPVVDQVGLLSDNVKSGLEQALHQVYKTDSTQIQVLIIDSLDDDYLEGYSMKVVDEWKLGKKGEEKGVLFLIAFKDRKMRIEVGRGLEGDLTDALAGRIVDMTTPYFKKELYEQGVVVAVNAIATVATGKGLANLPKTPVRRRKKAGNGFGIVFLLIAILFMSRRSGGLLPLLLVGSTFRGSGGYRGGSSWGGGGGGFSGGGASGGW